MQVIDLSKATLQFKMFGKITITEAVDGQTMKPRIEMPTQLNFSHAPGHIQT